MNLFDEMFFCYVCPLYFCVMMNDNKMKVIKHEFTSEELNKRLTMSDAALFTCLTQTEYLNLWHTNSLPTLEVALKFYQKGKK